MTEGTTGLDLRDTPRPYPGSHHDRREGQYDVIQHIEEPPPFVDRHQSQ